MVFGSIEVHAGDFKKGKHHQFVGNKLLMKRSGKFFRETILLGQLETVEAASEESVKRIGGIVGWGVAGGVLLGPVGLLAGLLAGGRGKDVTFVCKLKDGRKFMATASSKVFTELSAALFNSTSIAQVNPEPKAQGNFIKYIYLTLNWIFGVTFLLGGIALLFTTPAAGVAMLAASLLLFPPARKLMHSKTGKHISLGMRAAGVSIFLIASVILSSPAKSQKGKNEAAEKALTQAQAEKEATAQQQSIDYFNQNQKQVLNQIENLIARTDFNGAILLSSKYLASQNPELIKLNREAKDKQDVVEYNKKAQIAEAERMKQQQEDQRLAVALQKMNKTTDKLEGIDWFRDKSSPVYTNQNGFFLYIGNRGGSLPSLRLRIQYFAKKWLFIESFVMFADSHRFERNRVKFERDNNSEIWEWYDEPLTDADLEMIKAVIVSKESVIRFNGRQYKVDKTITPTQKTALQNVLDAYNALGGK